MPATDAFKNALVNEANAGTLIPAINTICLYQDTTERKCVSLVSGDFTIDTTNDKLRITKDIVNDTGTTFSFNKVYVRSGTTVYFITDVTATSVPAGSTVNVVWELTLSGSGSATGAFSSVNMANLIDMLLRILGGARGSKDKILLARFSYLDTGTSPITLLLAVSPTRSVTGTKVTASHDFTAFTASGALRECWILNDLRASDTDSAAVIIKVTTTSPVTVDTSMSIRHTFDITF